MNHSEQPNQGYDGPVPEGQEMVSYEPPSQQMVAPPRAESSSPGSPVDPNTVNNVVGSTIQLSSMGRRATHERGIEEPTPADTEPEADTKKIPLPKTGEEHRRERFSKMAGLAIAGKVPGKDDPRPTGYGERRRLDKIERRKPKAFKQSAEQLRLGSTYGAPAGTRAPLFLKRHITHDSSSQQMARPNRFGRVSDIDDEAASRRRLNNGDYSGAERRAELRAKRLFKIAEEAQQDLIKANQATRDGTDTLIDKTYRLGRRVKRAIRRRSPYTPN